MHVAIVYNLIIPHLSFFNSGYVIGLGALIRMPQFLDGLFVTTTYRMQRITPARDRTSFAASFVIAAGQLRLVKEFDFSDHPEASHSLRRLANTAFTTWLRTLATDLATGTSMSAAQIDVDHKGWAKVVLHADGGDLNDVTLEIPEAEDFLEMERAAVEKLGDILNRALRHQQENP